MDVQIKEIINNYKYLKKQNIIDNNSLDKLLFSKFIYDEDEIVDIITNTIKKNDFLNANLECLNNKSTPNYQLSLRDYFIYLKNTTNLNINNINFNLFFKDNINSIDIVDKENNKLDFLIFYPSYNPLLKNKNYNKYFKGISNKLFRLLSKINTNFYERFSSGDKYVLDFIDSLNTIKDWDKLDIIRRGELLINEIIGRLLYVSIDYICNYFSNFTDKDTYIDSDDLYQTLIDLKLTDDLLIKAKNIDNYNEQIVNKILELYPYSFDMLNGNIKSSYYLVASKYGYLFKDNKDCNVAKADKMLKTVSNYSYYIYNDICLKKIPYKDRVEYLLNSINYYNEYLNNKDDNYLFNYLRSIDSYIRSVNYYDEYDVKYKALFDYNCKFTNEERLNYLKKLISQYKENTLSITLGLEVLNKYPIALKNIKDEYYNNLKDLAMQIINFNKKYNFDLLSLIDVLNINNNLESKLRKQVINYYKSNQKVIEEGSIKYSKDLEQIINSLAFYSYKYLNGNEEDLIKSMQKDYQNIITVICNITIASNDVRYAILLFNLEYKIIEDIENGIN